MNSTLGRRTLPCHHGHAKPPQDRRHLPEALQGLQDNPLPHRRTIPAPRRETRPACPRRTLEHTGTGGTVSALKGHDGLTWRERRAARRREAQIRSWFFDMCATHGEQPIDPFDEKLLLCGCARRAV